MYTRDNVVVCTQECIAHNIGSAREAVARILKELKEEELITTQKTK
ncbi:helix-turn-helix domain-containing protein [Helicobacter ibis]|uniref:Helix-turn-helix domain-containing protein n=1 Tax=Helicobacter ibis TaxID=2962633 RepID=A0ABT4VHC1_9HELI|nr:helix-turn-helix domain-containing protein [Helicobacter ibis]